ncbi:ABC transporter permease [Crossiella sp. CA198]|uniref:ABC transporter permease n=1 Tax=Crossiella sp. CA198 TaxID=3455607 RepID=UPI003F8D8674
MTSATATPVSAGRRGGPWLSFARRRVPRFLLSLWVVITAAFLMIHLVPGDPVRAALGLTASPELVAARRAALGLDQPLPVQYWHYLGNLFRGEFGTSMLSGLPVSELIADRLPATVELAVLAFLVVLVVAVPVGVLMAVCTKGGRRRGAELGFTTTSVFLAAIPEFLLAVGLMSLFAVQLEWLPVAGREQAGSMVLPVLAMAVGPAAVLARIVRVELLSVLGNDFIRTARAKRLPARLIYLRHALPNALTASLTLAGMLLPALVAGTVLVENVFAWPGLGSTIVSSIQQQDYPAVQAIVLVYGAGVLLVNLLVDALLALLDPRSEIREV